MTARKREPRTITLGEIEQRFELASYWWGPKWCPAVHENGVGGGYGIRVVRAVAMSGQSQSVTYDYFDIGEDGAVNTAPRGHAKDFKPGRVVDIAAAAERFAVPQPDAMRIGL